MEQKGIFRSALGGFHKQDVLNYIDEITAGWDRERQELEGAAAADRELAQQQQEEAAQAVAAKDEAVQQLADAQTENEALKARLAALEEELASLQGLPVQVSALTEEVQETAARLDGTLTENARLHEALDRETERADTATKEMMAAEERLQARESELEKAKAMLEQYKALLGQAGTASRHIDGIVRPYMQDTSRRADEALENIEAALNALLGQMGKLHSDVEATRQTLRSQQSDSSNRLAAALEDWQQKVSEAATEAADTHFFR